MKRWAVGYINFFDNDLTIEIVEASTPIEAIYRHSKITEDDYGYARTSDLEQTKQEFFNCDSMCDVVEIPQ